MVVGEKKLWKPDKNYLKNLETKNLILSVYQLDVLVQQTVLQLVAKNNKHLLFPYDFEEVRQSQVTSLTCLVVNGLVGLREDSTVMVYVCFTCSSSSKLDQAGKRVPKNGKSE